MKNEAAGIIAAIEDLKQIVTKSKGGDTINTSKIEALTTQLEQSNSLTSQQTSILKDVVEEARKPLIKENRHIIEIPSKGVISLLTVLLVAVVTLASALYFVSRPNYDQRDNDLKYRYIKMKGEASPTTISDLENLFELNRDNPKIEEMYNTVKAYEEAVHKQAVIDEQTRLKQQEPQLLNNEAAKLKNK